MVRGMRVISKAVFSFLLVLSCLFFAPMAACAEEGITEYISAVLYGSLNTLSIPADPSVTTQSTAQLSDYSYQQRAIPSGTFERVLSTSTAGYTLGGYGVQSIPTWTGGFVTLKEILYHGQPTGYYQSNHSFDSVISTGTVYRLEAFLKPDAYSYSQSSTYISRTVNFSTVITFDHALGLETGKSYDYNLVLLCNGYFHITNSQGSSSAVISDVFASASGSNNIALTSGSTALYRDNVMYVSGTFTPFSDVRYFTMNFSFDVPVGYAFTATAPTLDYKVNGYPSQYFRMTFFDSDQNVIRDSLTDFEGSAGMDQSKDQLDGVISEYDEVEGSLFESGQAAFDEFDPSSLLKFSTGIYAAIASISQLMVGIISAMGEFSVLYTVGMVLVFFGILIGLWRFFR